MILSIDVGKGTEDVLLVDPKNGLNENCSQAIFPSQTQLMYRRLKQSAQFRHWRFKGEIMAGEPWHKLVYEHAAKSQNTVSMSSVSSKSLRYHKEQIESRGVKISEAVEEKPDIVFNTKDIDWNRVVNFIHGSSIEKEKISHVLLACQDHGKPKNSLQSSRDFRMQTIYHRLEGNGNLHSLLSSGKVLNESMPRHQAIAQSAISEFNHLSLGDVYVMDSSPAVVNGVLPIKGKSIVINLGNGHTLASIQDNSEIHAIYETHTGGVTVSGIKNILTDIIQNRLTHEAVLESGGHGLFQRKRFEVGDNLNEYKIFLIGPNRKLLHGFPRGSYSYPIASMMMAGPVGLIKAFASIHPDYQIDLDHL